MEEKSDNGESLPPANLYITVDSADLQKLKEGQMNDSNCMTVTHVKEVFNDALQDLGAEHSCQFVLSTRGVLICFEIVLSIILIIITATDYQLYQGGPVGMTMNSITLVVAAAQMISNMTGIINWIYSHALIFAIQVLKDIVLLVLQVSAFIVYMSCGYGSRVAVVIFTLILCCILILDIFYTSQDYNPEKHVKSVTRFKKKKRMTHRANKKVSYKRLQHY